MVEMPTADFGAWTKMKREHRMTSPKFSQHVRQLAGHQGPRTLVKMSESEDKRVWGLAQSQSQSLAGCSSFSISLIGDESDKGRIYERDEPPFEIGNKSMEE
jgi:hypothetical protein